LYHRAVVVARALGVLGAGLALTLFSPFGALNAGTTQDSTLTIDLKWPGEVVVKQNGKRVATCTYNAQKACTYNMRRRQETTLNARVPYKYSSDFHFTGWRVVQCQDGSQLQAICTFTMSRGGVKVIAKFARKSRPGHTWPSGGVKP
jgi:hypothetical protein